MAEFYIENGIDPTDPDHMDNFLSRQYERDPSPPRRQFFSGVVIARIKMTLRLGQLHLRGL